MTTITLNEETTRNATSASPIENVRRAFPQSEERTVEQERLIRKQELAATFRLFAKFGFSEGFAGHVTARDPGDPNKFWVNPLAMSWRLIKASDLILVDHEGNVVEGDKPVNAAAFAIHSKVHEVRPDAVAAAHTHSVYGKALASLGIPLAPITQDACAFYNDHGLYREYGGPALDEEEGKRIAASLGGGKASILVNHGLLTVGQSVAEAAWWFITMERSCQAQLAAMAAGTPLEIEPEIAQKTFEEVGNSEVGRLNFRPLWDAIIAEQPDLLQ
ncbi:ribulose-5-phosphate 4-epimerase/fuculose-1-phosphate aldolase [Arthrobacter sp. 1088]|nr:class II aldolase/adducin family protein [Arthrobacter sp. 1088]MDR6688631.1 ribulose-5-phosphate 4-epimerase/fuculose-1-phosphate aldolase [Arthrobacter sp. 1088]